MEDARRFRRTELCASSVNSLIPWLAYVIRYLRVSTFPSH